MSLPCKPPHAHNSRVHVTSRHVRPAQMACTCPLPTHALYLHVPHLHLAVHSSHHILLHVNTFGRGWG